MRFLSSWSLSLVSFLCWTSAVCAVEEAHGSGSSGGLLDLKYDTTFWAVVVFVTLLLILQRVAWKPILEGLKKREETIRGSLEEAKTTRAEMEKMRAQFQKELAEAHQQIPKLMEDARKKAEEMSAEMVAKASAAIQEERERLRRELEIAKDQALKEMWEQSAHLATLISAKAIGRSLGAEDHHRLIEESLNEMRQTAAH